MRYLLDTCIISELTKISPDKKITTWLQKQHSDNLYISVITTGELQRGIRKLPQGKKRKEFASWLETIIDHYGDRIVPFDLECSLTWGDITSQCEKRGTPLSAIDSILAAQAQHYGFVLVTNNVKDFLSSGINLIDPSTG